VLQPYLALSKNYFYKVPVLVMNKTLPWTSPCWLWSTCQAYWPPCSNSPEAPSTGASQRGWRAGCVYASSWACCPSPWPASMPCTASVTP
ncbi:hypothetical protein NHX12_021520, partial [Muraenolepis orangiensis]